MGRRKGRKGARLTESKYNKSRLSENESREKKMPIEMPKGLPFSVDTWSPCSDRKRHHFLTHAHKDHSTGISAHASYPIYSTPLTKTLLLHQFPGLDSSLFVDVQVGQTILIHDPDGAFSLTPFDANHCPGAVMFLFEGNFGSILHTGDCRLTSECLQNLPEKYVGKKSREPKCRLDYLFLDCTFGNSSIKIPSKYSAIRQVINCIWKHPEAPVVYLTCDLLAQDEILVEVSRTFGSKVFVDRINNAECFQALTLIAPEIVSEDASLRFQVFEGFVKFYERASSKLAEARTKGQPEPLFIRPSAQWYVFEEDPETGSQRKQIPTGAKKDSYGIWHVCYSSHSSRDELEWALQLLQPKRVVSTTPSCRAMELDYVKKHCFNTQVSSDDPLWKLMEINVEESTSSQDSTLPEITTTSIVSPVKTKGLQLSFSEATQTTTTNLSTSSRIEVRLNLSPPNKRPPVTLFGRARLALENNIVLPENKQFQSNKTGPRRYPNENEEQKLVHQVDFSTESEEQKSVQEDGAAIEAQYNKSTAKEFEMVNTRSYSCVGSSTSYNESLRKLYRSMNVPVPQPLPSLTKLMNSRKRAKRSFQM